MKFIWMLGPQASGKMTIGKLVAEKLGYHFLHNHQSIEFALEYFPYGSQGFQKINNGIRKNVFESMVEYSDTGFIFTYMIDFGDDNDINSIEKINQLFEKNGWDIYYIELEASLETRLERNSLPERIAAKPSKEDQEGTRRRMIESMKYQLNSEGNFPFGKHLVIDTEELGPNAAANRIIEFLEFGVE